jgi:hypothetical protein
MTRPRGTAAAATAACLALAALATGCGSTAGSAATAQPAASVQQLSAATALTSPDGGAWATIPMGGTGPNPFWQLFALPTAGGRWELQTPPAIATNGALILAAQDGPDTQSLVVGIRPSLDLSFSPVTATGDGGRQWTTIPPDAGLAGPVVQGTGHQGCRSSTAPPARP